MNLMFPQFSSPSIVWVPCIPNYSNGSFTPIYNLSTIPSDIDDKVSFLSRGGIKTKPWNHEEDEILKELVKELGIKRWAQIASIISSRFNSMRKGKNCRERWKNHLDPYINKGEWTYEEDLALLIQHQEFGKKWSKISKELVGRTENSVKNRLNTLMKSVKQTVESDNQAFINEYLINHLKSLIENEN